MSSLHLDLYNVIDISIDTYRYIPAKQAQTETDNIPLLHPGEDQNNPKGNCRERIGCTCTPYDECLRNDEERAKQYRNRRKLTKKELKDKQERYYQLRKLGIWQARHCDLGPIQGIGGY